MADTTFLLADLRERSQTDKRIDPLLLLAMIVLVTFAMLLIILAGLSDVVSSSDGLSFALFGLVVLVLLATYALSLYIVYQLVNRRDRHFRRIARLAEDARIYVRTRAAETGADLGDLLAKMEAAEEAIRDQRSPRGAVLWTVLCFVTGAVPGLGAGIVGLILYYLLMDDYKRHEANEAALTAAIGDAFSALGTQARLPFRRAIPDRSFWLYVLLTIVTVGVFGLWWLYVLMVDPNRHFEVHNQWEPVLEAAAQ